MTHIFKIAKVFVVTARNMLVLTGNMVTGNIEKGMCLVDEINDVRVYIHSIEGVNSSDSDEFVALTFLNTEERELKFLQELAAGSVVSVEK